LHGFPQNKAMWGRVAPALAEQYTVVCADLRGYGDSSKPRCLPDKSNYSFRAMAGNQFKLMRALGFDRFMSSGMIVAAGPDIASRSIIRMPSSA
jgi:haloacetate dehalogenase